MRVLRRDAGNHIDTPKKEPKCKVIYWDTLANEQNGVSCKMCHKNDGKN